MSFFILGSKLSIHEILDAAIIIISLQGNEQQSTGTYDRDTIPALYSQSFN